MGFRIAIIGDDRAVLGALAEQLTLQGFNAGLTGTAVDAVRADAVVIDGPLAPQWVEQIRALDPQIPVLVLGRTFVVGATDALAKPLRLGALVARLNVYRQDSGLAIGPWRFIEAARLLKGEGGASVKLTPKEAAILDYLYKAGGCVSRADLLGALWGYSDQADTHTVETHIHGLRRKLGSELLLTEPSGYRLVT